MGASSLGNPQSLNLYAYVENNPIDFTDPNGLLRFINYASCQTVGYIIQIRAGGEIIEIVAEIQICDTFSIDPITNPDPGGGGGGPIPIDDLIKSARGIIENPPNDECAKLLGKDALNKFNQIAGNIKYDAKPFDGRRDSDLLHARTDDEQITLNPNSQAFRDVAITRDGKNVGPKRAADLFKKYKTDRNDFSTAVIIHELLHVLGLPADSQTFADGSRDSRKSEQHTREILKKCFKQPKSSK